MQGIDFTTSEVRTERLVNCPAAADMVEWASSWASPPMRFVYESGPCGFQLARDIRALGHDCDIIAVSSIARSPEDRALKDDRRDAERLLEQVTSPRSKCKVVWIPDEECMTCRVVDTLAVGSFHNYILKPVHTYVQEDYLTEKGKIDSFLTRSPARADLGHPREGHVVLHGLVIKRL